ncbi:MAG: class I SAM-dependent methyltransferase [bacterium]|nr:class I SAM-dependent methyltransferase [bacterium]
MEEHKMMRIQQINNSSTVNKNSMQDDVDKINKAFYGRFNYPWPPMAFYEYTDQKFVITMLNQDIGSWENEVLPLRPKIWVAGCGTNQAVFTALKFPQSEVLATDLSIESLKSSEESAKQLGVTNLILEEKSINKVEYRDKFDYIICTGVIHHNDDPRIALEKLSAALKQNGILELMVYNYYHMLIEESYQKAIRMLCRDEPVNDLQLLLSTTKKLIANFPVQNLMANFLSRLKNAHDDAEVADILLQPVLRSYTIESFDEMITGSNLECLLPCINQFDKAAGRINWNMQFNDPGTSACYEALPDVERWQISNLLMMERAPMIWFYLQRKDSAHLRKTETEVCKEFLNTKFEPHSTTLKRYQLNENGKYHLNSTFTSIPAPPLPTDSLSGMVFKAVNSTISMGEIFQKLKIEPSFSNVNRVRINLTTSAFPYLKAIGGELARNTRPKNEDFDF